jgi:hypothetical protein
MNPCINRKFTADAGRPPTLVRHALRMKRFQESSLDCRKFRSPKKSFAVLSRWVASSVDGFGSLADSGEAGRDCDE